MNPTKDNIVHENCKGKTRDKRWPYSTSHCSRKAWKDGYCKTHHPDEVRRKNKDRNEKREALYQASLKRKYGNK